MITCSIPLAMASSTPYWIVGLSTSGSISFGCALVTGKKRVPRPAAGKIAFRTRDVVIKDNLYGGRDRRYTSWPRRAPRACRGREPPHPPCGRQGNVCDPGDDRPHGAHQPSLGGTRAAPRTDHGRL